METVKFADVPGYEGLYRISSNGVVVNIARMKALRAYKGKSNYYKVGLCKDGKVQYVRVHRLVAEAFIPNEHNKPQVDHIDGDTTNNNVDNLRWATPKENTNNPVTREKCAGIFASQEVRDKMSKSHKLVEARKRLYRLGDTGYTSTGKVIPT